VEGATQAPQTEAQRLFEMSSEERALRGAGYPSICGLDEAGRGPLAGPVVAATVILPAPYTTLAGVRDSKQLSARQRDDLFLRITQGALSFGIGIVDSDVIDQINILQATYLAMQQALRQLPSPPDYLLIDALTLPKVSIPQRGLIRGDQRSVSIAAASILAKVTRDRLMCAYHDEFPQYNFMKHKGYPTAEHLNNLQKYGPCRLHRKTFRGVK
jgi:ribonuclease HII